jgi:hypothetical protein
LPEWLEGETAAIEYAADGIGATDFKIGPALQGMTDAEAVPRQFFRFPGKIC